MAKGKRVKKKQRRVNGGTVAVAILAGLVALAAAGVLGLGAYVNGLDTIYPNINVAGVDIGGMSYDAAHSALLNADVGVPSGVRATAKLTDLVSVSVTSDEAGLTYSVTDTVDIAYAYGRDGGFFANMFAWLDCRKNAHDVYAESQFNESGVKAIVAQQAALANHGSTDAVWSLDGNELSFTKGSESYTVDEDAVFSFIKSTLLSGKSAETEEFSEEVTGGTPGKDPDFDAIYAEIYRAPQDAYYDPDTGTAAAAEDGVSFDLEAAKRLYASVDAGETILVPLVYTKPQVSGQDITDLLFKDKLAEKSTSLSTSTANRITNVSLAAAACNGTILNPGEEFSFNNIVGQRTEAKGYKEATGYSGGTSVPMVGGGICQVSSTIYYCTLISDLEITYRRNHSLTVTYLPAGLDATVSWGSIDFKFKNNRSYPIRIDAWVEGKTLYVEIWGTKESDITIELESVIIETIEPTVVEQVDETLAPGKTKVVQSGKNGCVSEAYKVYYDGDGNVIKRVLISKDRYSAEKRIVAVGPEASAPSGSEGTTTPTETAAPSASTTPTTPSEPTSPAEPTESTQPAEPTQPETPTEPAPTEPAVPDEPEPDDTDEEIDEDDGSYVVG